MPASCSAFFRDCTGPKIMQGREWAWRSSRESSTVTADVSGPRHDRARGQSSIFPWTERRVMIENLVEILLVEDNANDIKLAMHAFVSNNLANCVYVVRDGAEVLRRIKGDPRTQQLPVVIMTSSREECDIVESYQLGVNSYIVKPVDF